MRCRLQNAPTHISPRAGLFLLSQPVKIFKVIATVIGHHESKPRRWLKKQASESKGAYEAAFVGAFREELPLLSLEDPLAMVGLGDLDAKQVTEDAWALLKPRLIAALPAARRGKQAVLDALHAAVVATLEELQGKILADAAEAGGDPAFLACLKKLDSSLATRLVAPAAAKLESAVRAGHQAGLKEAKIALLPDEIRKDHEKHEALFAQGSHRVQEEVYGHLKNDAVEMLLEKENKKVMVEEIMEKVNEELWHVSKIPLLSCYLPKFIDSALIKVRW